MRQNHKGWWSYGPERTRTMNIMRHTAALLLAMALLAPAAYADEPEAPSKEPVQTEEAAPSPEEEGWNLLLVNPGNSLPEDFTVELAKLSNGMRVDKRICGELDAMLSACREAGLHPLICSAYRTQAVQTRLYNNKISRLQAAGYGRESAREEAGRWVAVPGTSEHQSTAGNTVLFCGIPQKNARSPASAMNPGITGTSARRLPSLCGTAAYAWKNTWRNWKRPHRKHPHTRKTGPPTADRFFLCTAEKRRSVQGDRPGVGHAVGNGEQPIEGTGIVPNAAGI